MQVRNPRISFSIEKNLYNTIKVGAKEKGLSLSLFLRDLIKEGLEITEDRHLNIAASERMKV